MSLIYRVLVSTTLCGLICASHGCAQDSSLTTKDSTVKGYVPALDNDALTDPKLANKQAPDVFRVKVETTKGAFTIEVNRSWSPNGADRFFNLVDIGYFKEIAIFRAIDGFMFQFGIHGDPKVNKVWRENTIQDDPSVAGVSNQPGFITFAKSGLPNSRSTQFFINLGDNRNLDRMGFTPFGKVIEGMEVVNKIETKYGENRGNIQESFQEKGNPFIVKAFPDIDFIKSITLMTETGETPNP